MALSLKSIFLLIIPYFFSIAYDPNVTAVELNEDLNQISMWAHQWKMSFNPEPTKQAIEVLFSQKRH